MILRASLLVALTAVPLLSGCSQDPSASTSATLEVQLATTAHDDGAVLFTVSGGPIDSVDASGYSLYLARIDENTTRVIITGELAAGAIARIHIPDERTVSQYIATLDQVAARGYALRDVGSYDLTLGR